MEKNQETQQMIKNNESTVIERLAFLHQVKQPVPLACSSFLFML
jgi:hypothetical protein